MKSEEGMRVIVKTMIKALNQMGVTLINIDVEQPVPVYVVRLEGKRLIQSVEKTLTSTYGILWIITYGKVTDETRDLKIDLKYELINEEEVLPFDDN